MGRKISEAWAYYVVKLLVCVERTAEEMVHGPRFFSTDNILHTGTVHISDDKIKKRGRDDKILQVIRENAEWSDDICSSLL